VFTTPLGLSDILTLECTTNWEHRDLSGIMKLGEASGSLSTTIGVLYYGLLRNLAGQHYRL